MSTVYFLAAYDDTKYKCWQEELDTIGTINVKIGGTDGPLAKRLAGIQTGNDKNLYPIHTVLTLPNFRRLEDYYKKKFASKCVRGEWFILDKKDIKQIMLDDHCAQLLLEEHHARLSIEKRLTKLEDLVEILLNKHNPIRITEKTTEITSTTVEKNTEYITDIEIDDIIEDNTTDKTFDDIVKNFIMHIKTAKPDWYREGSWMHLTDIRKYFDEKYEGKFIGQARDKFNKIMKINIGKRKEKKLINGHHQVAILLKKT